MCQGRTTDSGSEPSLTGLKKLHDQAGVGSDKQHPSEGIEDDVLIHSNGKMGEGVNVALTAISVVLSYSVTVLNALNCKEKKSKHVTGEPYENI